MAFQLMKILKICLVISCLLPFLATGKPRFDGANFFMELLIRSKKFGDNTVQIDDSDYHLIREYNWHIRKDCHTYYCHANTKYERGKKRTVVQMHRIIIGAMKGQKVDHKDGNGLNNTRNNIRICNDSQNAWNRKNIKIGELGYRNIQRKGDKYQVRITDGNRRLSIGVFNSIPEAYKS